MRSSSRTTLISIDSLSIGDCIVSRLMVTGPVSWAAFATLAVTWLATGFTAYHYAMKKQYRLHRIWMIRNFALTASAITLRFYLAIPVSLR
jgi:hypothetical protein